jgi:hypothetical protein
MTPRASLLLLTLATTLTISGCGGKAKQAPIAFQPDAPVVMNSTTPMVIATTQNNFVGTNRTIFVQFSHDMDASSINTGTFVVDGMTGTVSYDAPNRIGVFKSSSDFAINTVYHYSITTGARDSQGVHLPIAFNSAFRTRSTLDLSPPTVTVVSQGCVSPNGSIDVVFDEAMESSTINTSTFLVAGLTGAVTYDPLTRIASFTPIGGFAAETTYSGTITTGVTDQGGVALAHDFNFTFTTCPENQPQSFCSYTKGGYAGPGAPGQFFDAHFSDTFENDLTIGINDFSGPQHHARWTAVDPGPADLKSYLTSAAGGPSAAFAADFVNPTGTSNGILPEQAATLTLNIGFSGVASDPPGFGDLKLKNTGTSLDGATVNDILAFANNALAGNGLPSGFTFSSLNDLIDNINQSWDDCNQSDWAKQHLE